MRLGDWIKFSADFMGPGAISSSPRNNAVDTKSKIQADASPSDLAYHHLWKEPSSTDQTQIDWNDKRQVEGYLARNMDPFEWQGVEGNGSHT